MGRRKNAEERNQVKERLSEISDPLERIRFIDEHLNPIPIGGGFSITFDEFGHFLVSEKAKAISQLTGEEKQTAVRELVLSRFIDPSSDTYIYRKLIPPWETLNLDLLPYLVEQYQQNIDCDTPGIRIHKAHEASKIISSVLDWFNPDSSLASESGSPWGGRPKPFRGNKKKAFKAIVSAKMQAPLESYAISHEFFQQAIQICPKGLESWFLDILDQRVEWEKENIRRDSVSQDIFSVGVIHFYNFYNRENLDPETKKRAKAFLYRAINRKTISSLQLSDVVHFLKKYDPEPKIKRALIRRVIKVLESYARDSNFSIYNNLELYKLMNLVPGFEEKVNEIFEKALDICLKNKDLKTLNGIFNYRRIGEYGSGYYTSLTAKKIMQTIESLGPEDVRNSIIFLMHFHSFVGTRELFSFIRDNATPETIDSSDLYLFIAHCIKSKDFDSSLLYYLKDLLPGLEQYTCHCFSTIDDLTKEIFELLEISLRKSISIFHSAFSGFAQSLIIKKLEALAQEGGIVKLNLFFSQNKENRLIPKVLEQEERIVKIAIERCAEKGEYYILLDLYGNQGLLKEKAKHLLHVEEVMERIIPTFGKGNFQDVLGIVGSLNLSDKLNSLFVDFLRNHFSLDFPQNKILRAVTICIGHSKDPESLTEYAEKIPDTETREKALSSINLAVLKNSGNGKKVAEVFRNFQNSGSKETIRGAIMDLVRRKQIPKEISNQEIMSAYNKYLELEKKEMQSDRAIVLYRMVIERLRKRTTFELRDFPKRIPRPKRKPGNRNGRRTFRLGRVVQ